MITMNKNKTNYERIAESYQKYNNVDNDDNPGDYCEVCQMHKYNMGNVYHYDGDIYCYECIASMTGQQTLESY